MERSIIIDRIFAAVEEVTGMCEKDLVSKSREQEKHFGRVIVAHHLKSFGFSYRQIGHQIGGRGTSCVTYLIHLYYSETSHVFREIAKKVEEKING